MRSLHSPRRLAVLALAATAAALLVSGCAEEADAPVDPVTPTATNEGVPTASPFPTGTGAPSGSPTRTATTPTTEGTPTAQATTTPGESSGEATAEDAVAVLDRYFSAIGTGDYETAYSLWRNDGEASGQTFEEFVAGFDLTASVSWDIGEPGRIEPGAGQRYIEIPVSITARTSDGESQRFEGTYVLHHTADIPGATEEQLLWRIDSADVSEAE